VKRCLVPLGHSSFRVCTTLSRSEAEGGGGFRSGRAVGRSRYAPWPIACPPALATRHHGAEAVADWIWCPRSFTRQPVNWHCRRRCEKNEGRTVIGGKHDVEIAIIVEITVGGAAGHPSGRLKAEPTAEGR